MKISSLELKRYREFVGPVVNVVGIRFRSCELHDGIGSCGHVKLPVMIDDLDRRFRQRLPAIDLAHGDLA